MLVKELKELLKDIDDNSIVVISRDGEGNNYSPLSSITDEMSYLANTTWSGEIGFLKLTKEMMDEGYGEEDILEDSEPALILYPTN